MAQATSVGSRSIEASSGEQSSERLRFRRDHPESAVCPFDHGRIGKLFLNLLIEVGSFRGIALTQKIGEFHEHQRPRHKYRAQFGNRTVGSHGVIRLARASVNVRHLVLRHGGKFFVAARAELFQFFESLVVALEIFQFEGLIVAGEASGVSARILIG